MRLYLKLALLIAAAVLIHASVPPVGRCAWEAQFAARCWLARQLQDAALEARLVAEARERLVQDLRGAFDEPELPVHQLPNAPLAQTSVAIARS